MRSGKALRDAKALLVSHDEPAAIVRGNRAPGASRPSPIRRSFVSRSAGNRLPPLVSGAVFIRFHRCRSRRSAPGSRAHVLRQPPHPRPGFPGSRRSTSHLASQARSWSYHEVDRMWAQDSARRATGEARTLRGPWPPSPVGDVDDVAACSPPDRAPPIGSSYVRRSSCWASLSSWGSRWHQPQAARSVAGMTSCRAVPARHS